MARDNTYIVHTTPTIPYTLYLTNHTLYITPHQPYLMIHYTSQKMEEEKRAAVDLYTLLLYLIIPCYTLYLTENGRGEEGSS